MSAEIALTHQQKEIVKLLLDGWSLFWNESKGKYFIENHENDLKDFSFTFLELPKFTKKIDQLTNTTEMWAYFFKHAEETTEKELRKLVEKEQIIGRAYEELDRYSWNEEELLTYEQAEKYELTYRASMDQKFDEGVEKGEKLALYAIAKKM